MPMIKKLINDIKNSILYESSFIIDSVDWQARARQYFSLAFQSVIN